MKKMMCKILVYMFLLTLAGGLTGCSKTADQQRSTRTALGVVLAPTACSQGLNLASPLVADTVEETIKNYGWICVINADGNPAVVASQDFDIDEIYKSASAERLKKDAQKKSKSFLAGMGKIIADNEEVDYLKSIQLCARNLSSLEGYDSKIMIVVGTGLSTAGVLNFQNNLLQASPEALADALDVQHEIPSLEGIRVYWQHLADTAAPQAEMNAQQRQALKNIWSEIIRRGGGEVEFSDMVYSSVSDKTPYPKVSVVDLPAAPVISLDNIQKNETVFFNKPIALSEEQIRFVGDSDRYVDPEAAKEVLKPIAEILVAHKDVNVLLCGCIAGDGMTEYGRQLSLRRADAVKHTLMDLSVSENQIITRGLGTENPWHIKKAGLSGALAAQNRKVVLLNTKSQLGKTLMSQ